MAFYRPTWAPRLSDADVPDDIPLFDFLFDDRFRPRKCQDSPPPFIDGVSGHGFGIAETRRRVEWLAAGLARQLGIGDFSGEAWRRVVGVFAVNNVRGKKPPLYVVCIMLICLVPHRPYRLGGPSAQWRRHACQYRIPSI